MPEPCYTIDKGQGKAKSKIDERDEDLNRKEVSGLGTSDMIARFIQAELEEANGVLELQRSDLAQRFGCVPSQINYVITSRFTPEQGYRIESRRGGGGCILITRADSKDQALMALINSIGPAIDEKTAKAHLYNLHYQGLMDARSAKIMESALTGWNQHGVDEQVLDQIRARQFKQMLLAYIN